MNTTFKAAESTSTKENETLVDISKLVYYDDYSKRHPHRNDFVIVQTHVYELFKHNTARFAQIFQQI